MPIPVNIITGVLGVGKTTAIQHLMSQRPPHEKWAIVVNEFGALGIDGAVLDTAGGLAAASGGGGGDGGVVVREVAGGCLCCAVAAPFTVAVTQVLFIGLPLSSVHLNPALVGRVSAFHAIPLFPPLSKTKTRRHRSSTPSLLPPFPQPQPSLSLNHAQVLRRAKPDRLLIEPSGMGHPGGLFDALSGEHLGKALELRATVALVDMTEVAQRGELFHSAGAHGLGAGRGGRGWLRVAARA